MIVQVNILGKGNIPDIGPTPKYGINLLIQQVERYLNYSNLRVYDCKTGGLITKSNIDEIKQRGEYIYMTQAEYEAIETPDPTEMYWVVYPASGCYIVWKNGEVVTGDTIEPKGGFCDTTDESGAEVTYRSQFFGDNMAIAYAPGIADQVQLPADFCIYPNLKNVDIAKGVTSIGTAAFKNCTELEAATIPTDVTTIGASAFSGCAALGEITLPTALTTIGESAFSGCTNLELASPTIPTGITTIGASTFSGCAALGEITLPDALTTIGASAFSGCTNLTLSEPDLPTGITTLGASAFSGCAKVEGVTVPSGITTIGGSTFLNCTSLETVSLPAEVTEIGATAFSGCTSLADFNYTGTIAQWEEVTLMFSWNGSCPFTVVHCSDGDSTRLS